MKKAVVVEAKANLRSRATTKDIDQHCPQGSRSANSTAAKAITQGQLIKYSQLVKTKSKLQAIQTSAPQHSDNAETSEKARKENKDRAPAVDDGDCTTHLRNWITQGVDPKGVRGWQR